MWKEPNHSQFLTMQGDFRGVRYANLWGTMNLEKHRINNVVFYTYHQQLCMVIVDKPRITKQVTDMYIEQIRVAMDMNKIYIKPRWIKNVDWDTGAYRMEQEDIDEIIKEWLKEWKSPTGNLIDSNKDLPKDKYKGNEKIGEKKDI